MIFTIPISTCKKIQKILQCLLKRIKKIYESFFARTNGYCEYHSHFKIKIPKIFLDFEIFEVEKPEQFSVGSIIHEPAAHEPAAGEKSRGEPVTETHGIGNSRQAKSREANWWWKLAAGENSRQAKSREANRWRENTCETNPGRGK